MSGLPKLPGLSFADITQTRFHLSHTLDVCNGYKVPRSNFLAPGGRELNSNSVKYISKPDMVRFDPSLTYGRTRSVPVPQFIPHYALYDQKCLTFRAFFKQTVIESPDEYYRVRHVNIIYFLEDDTITVMEPRVPNSGIDQGRLIRRGKIPKYENGMEFYSWKDLAVGKDICFYGIVFHMVDCDGFTREYMASQGLNMTEAEEMPDDPYMTNRHMSNTPNFTKTPPADDKLRRFLEYDAKVLKFKAVWDDRDTEYGELRKYEIYYFLSDDTISVKEIHERNDGRDPFQLMLKKTKLPKIYTDKPVTFPSIYFELTDAEVAEFYQPKDLLIGETIHVLGRKMLLYDCDNFTRNYFKKVLCINQGHPVSVEVASKIRIPEKKMPPHDGFGTLEDSLQNTLTFLPKPPKQDVLRQILNANKNLRYTMIMDAAHPEDSIRKFVLSYSLADSTCKIHEPPINNSGISGGKYLQSTLLVKPGTNPLNPDYYSPADFYIGNIITVFQQRFIITGADLYVYRYMIANSDKFPCEVIDNMRNYMFNNGYLNEDLEDQLKQKAEDEKINFSDKISTELERNKTEMEKCLESKHLGSTDVEYETAKRAEILREYEETLRHNCELRSKDPPYGIKPTNKSCAYPVVVGNVKGPECPEEEGGIASYTPKHIDTKEEKVEKYYAKILKNQKKVCQYGGKDVECMDPPNKEKLILNPRDEKHTPLMVAPPDLPPGACNVKRVQFSDNIDHCDQNRFDLCDLKSDKTHCECMEYHKKC